jgi:Uma2 family endonuclease
MSTLTAPPIPIPPLARAPLGPPSPRPKTYGLDPTTYRFSVAQYNRMVDLGILGPDDKVELLGGYVVLKMARNAPHDGTMDVVRAALDAVRPAGWILRCQQAIVLTDSVPEPDYAFVRGSVRSYFTRHPGPADIGLVVEVANTSLDRDLEEKAQVYARSNIVAYWVIDATNGAVHIFTQPSGPTPNPAYGSHVVVSPPATVSLSLDGIAVVPIPAADLLP